MPAFDPFKEVPEYAEAVQEEQFQWSCSFLGLHESICGMKVKPLSTRHLLLMSIARTPFFFRASTEALIMIPGIENHVKRFLWIVSPCYSTRRFARLIFDVKYECGFSRNVRIDEAIKAIRGYVEEVFSEFSGNYSDKVYFSIAASTFHFLCSTYHLSGPEALDFPLKCVAQLQRNVKQQAGGILFKPSDAILSRWLSKS